MRKNEACDSNGMDLSCKQVREANLLAIVENTDDLIYSLDREFRYITLNGALKKKLFEIFGVEAKVGDRTFDFLLDIDAEEIEYWKGIYSLALQGESVHFVKEFTYSGTQEFWNFSINPIRQNNQITGLSCLVRDTTELRKTRIALETSEKKYRQMFNSNPLPSWIYDAEKLKFIDVNEATLRHYGYSREEFLSRTIKDIYPPKDFEDIMQIIRDRNHIKQPYKVERQHIKKNGEIIDVSVLTCPIDIDGEMSVLVVAEDITEKKKAAASLRESEERYRLVSENPLLGIGWATLTGDILNLNETFCNMMGYTLDELKKVHYSNITHPDDMELEAPLFKKLAAGELDHYKLEKRYIRKSGEYIWVELNLTRVKNSTGEEYCIGIIQDITLRKEIENTIQKMNEGLEEQVHRRTEQLKSAYAELEAFSYSVSHDLRSPLRVVNGFVKILMNDMADRMKPEEKEHLRIIGEKAVHMDIMIRDMLKLSSVDKANLLRHEVDMRAMVESVLEELNYSNGGHHADIIIGDLPKELCDHSMVKQVWTNLIGNAIKYSAKRPQARIEIGVININDIPTYFVRDNGVGFDMKNAGKLFTAFQRFHGNHEFEGTGIGLALVNRIISKHGGRIWADAKADSGATFYFCLSQ